jgi:hypothetical protein
VCVCVCARALKHVVCACVCSPYDLSEEVLYGHRGAHAAAEKFLSVRCAWCCMLRKRANVACRCSVWPNVCLSKAGRATKAGA